MLIAQSCSGLRAVNPKESISSIEEVTAYEERGPILILNDSAFGPSGYDFDGSGTSSSPYLIRGYNITDDSVNLIRIENTRKYFKISNCYLDSNSSLDYSCIYMENVTHGTINGNILCDSQEFGIEFRQTNNSYIFNNTIYDHDVGFYVEYSTNNDMWNNTIYNCTRGLNSMGVILLYSTNHNIMNNVISHCFGGISNNPGIAVVYSTNITISSNEIYHSDLGILAYDAHNSTISSNILHNITENGIMIISNSRNVTVSSNQIYNCSNMGIFLDSDNNTINFNVLYNNTAYGLYIDDGSANNTVLFNSFLDNKTGGSQAFDIGVNTFINSNYWIDYSGSGNYTLDGAPVNNNDTSPLTNPVPQINIKTPIATTYGVSTISVALFGNALNYKYYIDGVDNQNKTWTKSEDRTLADGSYTLHAYGVILTGTTHISVTFTIDASTVSVDITSPTNTTYKKNSVNLTYTSSGGAITVYIDGTASTTALSSGSVISDLADGSHNITIVIADPIGNTAKDSVIFTTDTSSGISFPELITILLSFALLVVFNRRHKQT